MVLRSSLKNRKKRFGFPVTPLSAAFEKVAGRGKSGFSKSGRSANKGNNGKKKTQLQEGSKLRFLLEKSRGGEWPNAPLQDHCSCATA